MKSRNFELTLILIYYFLCRILAEYKMILSEAIPGIYTIPSNESSLIWNAVIFVRKGCYMNGVFRFNISLSENFPNDNKTPVRVIDRI